MFTPDSLQLLVNPLQKVPSAFGDLPRKNVETRWPSAFSRSSAESPASLRRYTPEKRSRQIAFGFGSKPRERPHLRPTMCSRKTFRPDDLRILVIPLQKVPPAFGDIPRKNIHAGQPSALDLYGAKSLSSVRRCTPAIRLGLSALGYNKDKRNGA